MKPKLLILGVCALLAGIMITILLSGGDQEKQAKGRLEIAPDGTIAVPRNDNTRIIAHFEPKTNTPSKTDAPTH